MVGMGGRFGVILREIGWDAEPESWSVPNIIMV